MTGFHDVQLPLRLSLGAIGGREYRTEILALASGREVRNTRWAAPRRRWDVGASLTDLASVQLLIRFFEARQGRLYGFRFRDPFDFSSAPSGTDMTFEDQTLAIADGVRTTFQLLKSHSNISRKICKPVPGTVAIGVDGTRLETGWSLDATNGTIIFDQPPAAAARITAGFEFDCPVRFEQDRIEAVIEAFGAGRVTSIGLVELTMDLE